MATVRVNPLDIVGFEPDSNMRTVSWNQKFLERVKKEHRLKHGQAVVFCNKAQDRFRLVAVFYGLAVLILPPIDQADRISLYLKISRFLTEFRLNAKVTSFLDEEIKVARKRLAKRKHLAARAAQKRSS